jgi:NADH-quinone oxidoreductase subunit G
MEGHMLTVYIEGKPYEVEEGNNLLHACLGLGFDIPYFCWHPAMHSVGSCRLCAVKQFKDGNDKRGRIVMSCMTPVSEGMRISINDEEVRKFRAGIIELLMINHPHDCPVCDEGGECHLQDMTLMTGHIYRRFRYKKRTFTNQDIGPFLHHEINRCIHCYRCVRFYRDYAGGRDLDAFASHHFVYFGRYEDGALENVFSGNLVEVCPTGVFTDRTLKRHYTRKWDLQTAPSICVHCALGCNTFPGERYGTLRRILNRYNSEVNGYFLCDRGRFGYEYVNHEKRIRISSPGGRPTPSSGSEEATPAPEERVLTRLSHLLHFGAHVMGVGSPRASLEANYALRKLVGPENFYSGMSENEAGMVRAILDILRNGPAPSASLKDTARSDAVLILGEDIMNTAPLLGFAVRQSVRNRDAERAENLGLPLWSDTAVRIAAQDEKSAVFIVSHDHTGLDDIACETFHAVPDDQSRLGFMIAHDIDSSAPVIDHMGRDQRSLARRIAEALQNAERPLII